MKTFLIRSIVTVIFIVAAISCVNRESKDPEKISIYAAMGASGITEEICSKYAAANHKPVIFNFASSGTLARQIENGADADIFISANKQWISYLSEKNILIDTSVSELARNKLVLITSVNNNLPDIDFSNHFEISQTIKNKIAIGDARFVPVGKYTMQVFDTLQWTKKVSEKTILCKDVSSVLRYVELQEADWGIVYYSEALKSDKVKIHSVIPDSLHSPIVFYITAIQNCNKDAFSLINYFLSDSAQLILNKNGFN